MDIKIAICDDEQRQTEYLKLLVNKWAIDNNMNIYVAIYNSAEEYKSADICCDILLLDIQMKPGGQSGVELAKEIRQTNSNLVIIFITGYPDYISEGYDVSALHYLMKPLKEDKLYEVLTKAVNNINQTDKQILFTVGTAIYRIQLSDVRYIEAQDHYIIIRTLSKEYKIKMTLSEIENLLNNNFFRCQRSFIVNLKFVYKITRTNIVLDDMTEISISRGLYEAVNQAIINYYPSE